jgi:diguanylate cyclase (GGDEF)-like protein
MLGYSTGDELLRIVAARLHSVVKDHDAVARIGGDEFALIQVGDFRDEDVAARAQQVINLIGQPFLACGQRLELGASVGIALGPDDGNTADELIQDAALAMRRVKESRTSVDDWAQSSEKAGDQPRSLPPSSNSAIGVCGAYSSSLGSSRP